MTGMDLERRAEARSRRWRRLSRIVSGSLGVAAVGGAVYLGSTAPLVSPVQPAAVAAAPAAAAPAAADDAAADDPGPTRQDGDRRGGRDGGFDAGRRR